MIQHAHRNERDQVSTQADSFSLCLGQSRRYPRVEKDSNGKLAGKATSKSMTRRKGGRRGREAKRKAKA
jgi:hypothetical protein